MYPDVRVLFRAAEGIRGQLRQAAVAAGNVELPEAHWTECQSLVRQLRQVADHGWINAQAILQDRLERALVRCLERFQEIVRQSSSSQGRPAPPTVREVFDDLVALSDEFDGLSIDSSSRTLSVTTEPVVLEEIELGPFEIRLHWERIGERRSYDVVALAPNTSRESSDITHPHVRGEQLCEGDGRLSIEGALRTGRLLDFFQIVTRILGTYNSGSAYVSLSQWDGIPCSDCGDFLPGDEHDVCDRCEGVLCLNCSTPCARCDSLCCHSCTDYCRACEAQLCPACQRPCDSCRRLHCSHCLSENGLCEECQEQEHAESFDEDENPPAETAAAVAPTTGDADPVAASDPVAV